MANEPTLTCSEVVERLFDECYRPEIVAADGVREFRSWFDRKQAEKILHFWRECRVQELEEALREVMSSATPNQKEHPTMFAAWTEAEKTLHSEWREQIRKGQK